jgi:perosamine synthetase
MLGIDRTILLAALEAGHRHHAAALRLLAEGAPLATTWHELLSALEAGGHDPAAVRTLSGLVDGGPLALVDVETADWGKGPGPEAARRGLAQALARAGAEALLTTSPAGYPPGAALATRDPFAGLGDAPRAFAAYGRQQVDEADVAAVARVLRSDWLTCGPAVEAFELAVADFCSAPFAAAVSSGTAGLHCAMQALNIGPGDEVITTPLTFAATANCVLYQGATPVFADVDPGALLLDPAAVRRAVTPRTRAIIAVDYAGQPCRYDELRAVADECGLALVADACHSLGASYRGRPVGTLADITVFSFHPVKHITTGEGGMVLCARADLDHRVRQARNHGITVDFRARADAGAHGYDIGFLGHNYRLPDINCGLGLSQLAKLPGFLERRRTLAETYRRLLAPVPGLEPLALRPDVLHAYHLFVVRVAPDAALDRDALFAALRDRGIGVNVHYPPAHLFSHMRDRLGAGPGLCPTAEDAALRILTLPLHPGMGVDDVAVVAQALAHSLSVTPNSSQEPSHGANA